MNYISENDVIEINSGILEIEYPLNILSFDRISSAVNQIKQNVFGKELYEGVFVKAANLAFFISKGHGFVDANKRTAALSCILFLKLNGFIIDEKSDIDLAKNILKLSTNTLSKEKFAYFLENICDKKL